jgi:ABC-2 type transport system permease protein
VTTTAPTTTRTVAPTAVRSAFVGTWPLLRLALRRDRILIPVWVLFLVSLAASSAGATVPLYPSEASRVAAAAAVNGTPALVALYGPVFDPTSIGALAMLKLGTIGATLVGVFAIVTVVRHTRAEEENGRLELVAAAAVGRQSALAAAVLVSLAASAVIGLLTAAGMTAGGLDGVGSLAVGLAWFAMGAAFTGIAAVTAQVATTARVANGLAGAVLGLAFVLRAAGDAQGSGTWRWLSWLSPIGWSQQVRPYAGNRWWAVLPSFVLLLVTLVVAYALAVRRDMGAGIIADRPGPAQGLPWLRSATAAAWRLERGALGWWLATFALLGLVVGLIASGVVSLLDSPEAQQMITRLGGQTGLIDAFLSAELGIAAVIASVFGIQAAGRLNLEESSGRTEAVLATGTSRTRWALAYTAVAVLGTAALMLVVGLVAGVVHAADTGDGADVGRVLAGALVQLPAVWVVVGIVVAAYGITPRLAAAGWVALGLFLALGEIGPLLNLDRRIVEISPFAHVPRLPGAGGSAVPLVVLLLVALALGAGGLAALRRRDIG